MIAKEYKKLLKWIIMTDNRPAKTTPVKGARLEDSF